MHFIFDLDETVIDSHHRQGETLAEWIALNTRENILKDTLLPLADLILPLLRRSVCASITYWLALC